ncbi:MAG: beta-galactosidase [Kiritimatiellales bacterium]
MFAFGTQYHRPPTPKMDKWENDFKTMKDHGFNMVRGWAMWGWLNPKEDVFDFSELERFCDLGLKYDIKTILLVNLESTPAWLYKKYPETLYTDQRGIKVVPHTVHNTCCGGFPGHCLHWPEIQGKAVEFIEALVKKFAGHPALYGWEPHNEPLHEPARYYRDGNGELFCYCDKTLEKFIEWLKVKYNNEINLLNQIWQRRYGFFDEIIPPVERGSYSDWADWRLFHIEDLVEQDKWRTQVIRDNDPDHPVMIHTRSASSGRNIVFDCTDDWRLSQFVDSFGFASFPAEVSILDHAMAGDINRAAAQGKEFWMHELASGPYGIGLDIPPVDLPGDRVAGWALTTIAQGAKGLLMWQFRTEQFGAEYGFNLVNLDGSPNQRLKAVERVGRLMLNNEALFARMKPQPAEIAVGYSPMNPLMLYVADGSVAAFDHSYLGTYRMLCNANVSSVDIVRLDIQAVDDDFTRYKVLYIPLALWMDEKTAEKIRQFVEQGGTVISEPSLALIETDYYSADTVPGMGLHEVFGCRREIMGNTKDTPVTIHVDGGRLTARFLREILIPESAEVIGRYETGEPAITLNHYGKGKAVYFGSNVFNQYYHSPAAEVCNFFEKRFHAGISRWAATSASEQTFLKIMEADGARIVFLFNITDQAVDTCLTVNADVANANDIYNECVIAFEKDEAGAKAVIHLDPYASCVFLFEGI